MVVKQMDIKAILSAPSLLLACRAVFSGCTAL